MIPTLPFPARPGLGAFSAKDVIVMERRPLASGAQKIVLHSKAKPTFAGVDPYNFYIDRNSDDNVKDVTVSSSGEATRRMVDLSLVLDVSSSIGSGWPAVRDAARTFVNRVSVKEEPFKLCRVGFHSFLRGLRRSLAAWTVSISTWSE